MSQYHDERAALLTLLRERKETWGRIASRVAFEGSALAVLRESSGETLFDALLDSPATSGAVEEIRAWDGRGLRFVSVLDADYPRRLLDIRETPPFLFYEGTLLQDDAGLSVVGSRGASPAGLKLAGEVARFLVEQDLTVISGLAAGIDAAAHRAALEAGGRTVAFIGTGITKSYPTRSAGLQREIADRGLVLSQFFPDAPPTKQSFPMRNASMSGYGLATIVIEASERSGTRIQTRLAGEHGRPVILTEQVASSTTWGGALRGLPGVYVVGSMAELASAVAEVQDRPRRVDEALRALMSA